MSSFAVSLDLTEVDVGAFLRLTNDLTTGARLYQSGAKLAVGGFGLSRWPTLDDIDIDIAFEGLLEAVPLVEQEQSASMSFFEQHLGVTIEFEPDGMNLLARQSSFVQWSPPLSEERISRFDFLVQAKRFLCQYIGFALLTRAEGLDASKIELVCREIGIVDAVVV